MDGLSNAMPQDGKMGRVHSLKSEYTQICRTGTEISDISAGYKNIGHKHTTGFALEKVTKTRRGTIQTAHTTYAAALRTTIRLQTRCRKTYAAT